MATITFVENDGTSHSTDLVEGESIMQIATSSAIPGIDGDCGGEAACGTCHIIVPDEWAPTIGTASDKETPMLDMTPECTPNSRLACQVIASEDMDGLAVRLPEYQM